MRPHTISILLGMALLFATLSDASPHCHTDRDQRDHTAITVRSSDTVVGSCNISFPDTPDISAPGNYNITCTLSAQKPGHLWVVVKGVSPQPEHEHCFDEAGEVAVTFEGKTRSNRTGMYLQSQVSYDLEVIPNNSGTALCYMLASPTVVGHCGFSSRTPPLFGSGDSTYNIQCDVVTSERGRVRVMVPTLKPQLLQHQYQETGGATINFSGRGAVTSDITCVVQLES
eukprot:GFYU01000759.1.p1 GENE.GFYU01000759.1~~GFYU01000759.1.p1  ORF type:complete len:242 (+),score=14.03 GFYU01000759.1:44-727(+)